MSWHTSAIVIKGQIGRQPERLLETLGFPKARLEKNISFDEADSSSLLGKAVTVIGDWTVIFDPKAFGLFDANSAPGDGFWPLSFERRLDALSKHVEVVFGFLLEGTSDTHAFSYHADGIRRRCFLFQQGNPIIDIGVPIEAEKAAFEESDDMEQRIFLIAEKLGVQLFHDPKLQYGLCSFDS